MAFVVANVGGGAALPCTSRNQEYRSGTLLLPRGRQFPLVFAANNKRTSGSSTFRASKPGGKKNVPTTETGQTEFKNSIPAKNDNFGWNQEMQFRDGDGDRLEMPKLPGDQPDFWEGPQWNGFGFFMQYMWAFGALFAVVACGVAVATYNGGATDFKETPAYKESIKSQELFEDSEGSGADVFESNPTEVAPSLN